MRIRQIIATTLATGALLAGGAMLAAPANAQATITAQDDGLLSPGSGIPLVPAEILDAQALVNGLMGTVNKLTR